MKNRWNRIFWTAMGSRLLGIEDAGPLYELPDHLLRALEDLPALPRDSIALQGEGLQDRRGRHIYTVTWNILREKGFQRPFRLSCCGGMELLVPFRRGSVVVSPQGFQKRVPFELRALALVGKNALLRSRGFHLVVSSAVDESRAWNILRQGNCSVCTPDKLAELLVALDFSL